MKSKKYYLVSQSCGPLFIDIVNAFVEKKLNVTLITGRINVAQDDINTKAKIIFLNKYRRNSIIGKITSWVFFSFSLLIVILFSKQKSTWLISTNPPFAPWLIPLIKKKKSKVVLLVYDIYPEVLDGAGILSNNSLIYKLWSKLTRISYTRSDKIITLGESMKRHIAIGLDNESRRKVIAIPNWNVIRFNNDANISGDDFRAKRNALNKLHIVYSGNLGATHDFKTILEVAKALKSDERFVFTIIGEGYKKDEISGFIKQNKLENINLFGFKEPPEVPGVYLSADISLITLGSGVEKASIPSKTYDSLAAGSALLVIASTESELKEMLTQGKCGACFEPGDVKGVMDFLFSLASDKVRLMNYKRAAKQLSEKYSPKNAFEYVEVMTSV